MKTIIVGMGNPVLTDDSLGIRVVRALADELCEDKDVVTRELYAGGLRLMEALQGYQQAVIIDAMVTEGGRPGTIYCLAPSDLVKTRNTCSTHDASLADALEFGKALGLSLPGQICIWAVEAGDVATFSEDLTEPVQEAVPGVMRAVLRQLQGSCGLPA